MKKIVLYLSIILVPNVIFLFFNAHKKPPVAFDHNYIKINDYMGILVNADAFAFIGAAIQPGYLFRENYNRQSRPGYIIIGSGIGYCIYYASYPFHNLIKKQMRKSVHLKEVESETTKSVLYFCIYAGYVLLNIGILLCCIWIFDKLIYYTTGKWKNSIWLYLATTLMLVANQETKYFLWTPHQQMLNILTPILCIYSGFQILKPNISPKKILLYSLLSGMGLLIYGNFILLFWAILICSLHTLRNKQLHIKKPVIFIFQLFAAFALPTFCWISILKIQGISFYSSELNAFRQFIWMADELKISLNAFINALIRNTIYFLQTLGSILFPLSALAAAIFIQKGINKISLTTSNPYYRLALFSGISFFIFFWLLGYYADRLTYSLAPFLLYIFALTVNQKKIEKKKEILLIAIILIEYFLVGAYDAPHFSNLFFYS